MDNWNGSLNFNVFVFPGFDNAYLPLPLCLN